jgi:hypothetical protein
VSDIYSNRRERVVAQVLEKWTRGLSIREDIEAELAQACRAAADITYTSEINDLDWEAAALVMLRDDGLAGLER